MLTPGTQLGPYKILGPLGAGGMGEVYRAQDARLGREVALKILPPRFADDPDRLVRFEREARAVAALAHPNIVVVHDFGTDHGVTFAVSELLEGESLQQRLSTGALPWRKAVELAISIADGLAAAHAKGIVHRDLKPANVFVTSDERVKILDFGLAKLLAEDPKIEPLETQDYSPALTETGVVLGTAPYMSPEQLRGQPVDARSDIFSFGCTLYEMVAGKRPFTGPTGVDVRAAVLVNDPPDLTDSGKKIPVELERLIRRCLEKNPEARFQSARDLAFALRGILTGGTSVGLFPWMAAAGIALAVGILAFVFWPRNPPAVPPAAGKVLPAAFIEVAVLPFVNASKDVEADYLADGLPSAVIKSLSEVGQLRVRAFSAGARLGTTDLTLGEVGRKLKVQALLTGRVTARKDGIILTVELVNVADESVVWSERYEHKIADLQEMQFRIAREICTTLKVSLTAEEEKRLGKRYTANPEAHKLYLLGRHHWFKSTEESLKKAEACYLQAIKLDSNFALAHACLADAYLSFAFVSAPNEAMPKARAAAQKALDLDPKLAEAHLSMGMFQYLYNWDWVAAENELKLGIELNPLLALGYSAYYFFLVGQGRLNEAWKAVERATQLDPVTPFIVVDIGWYHYCDRQFDKAIEQSHKVLQIDPNYSSALQCLGESHVQKGEYVRALAAFEIMRKLDDTPMSLAFVALGHGLSGDKEKARSLLKELEAIQAKKTRYVDPMAFVAIHLGLGEKDQACAWLESAHAEHSAWLVNLKVDPLFDPLRSETRFDALLKKMNFPKTANNR